MTEQELYQESTAQFAAVVEALCARYDWRLIPRDEFVSRLAAHPARSEFRDLAAAAFNLYTLALHAACSGTESQERQERAYNELARLLYDIAYRHYGERNPDLVQETLGDIFEHFALCRKPGAFVAFAKQRMRSLLKRRWGDRFVSLDDNEAQLPELQDEELEWVLADELRERVAACRELFLREHKGARLQFEAVWMKFVLNLDDAAIANRLGKEPRQVYVLRSRGLKKLRREPAWQALAADLGLAPS